MNLISLVCPPWGKFSLHGGCAGGGGGDDHCWGVWRLDLGGDGPPGGAARLGVGVDEGGEVEDGAYNSEAAYVGGDEEGVLQVGPPGHRLSHHVIY